MHAHPPSAVGLDISCSSVGKVRNCRLHCAPYLTLPMHGAAYFIVVKMRSALLLGLLLAAAALSLSAVLTPFLSFHRYALQLPIVSSHSHIQNSLASVRDAGLASLCLSPLLSPFCSWPTNSSQNVHATLVDLTLVQDKMGEQLAHHGLADSFNSVLSIQRACDIALAFDDIALLFGDGNLELQGTGHVRLLVDIDRASRSLWAALYRTTLHVELGLQR